MLGACLLVVAVTWLVLSFRDRTAVPHDSPAAPAAPAADAR
jgi:hypothetical protein